MMLNDTTVHLLIRGHFQSGEFPDWICHRAGVLNLSGWVNTYGDDLIEVHVHGNPILVDAMELACSIGPYSVVVQTIDSKTVARAQPSSEFVKIQ